MAFRSSTHLLYTVMVMVVSLLLIEANQLGIHETVKVEPLHRHQREFDYFALALQWPGTYCRSTRHCCSQNACCRGSNAPTAFTIHGLWPDYNDGTWPACCTARKFDEKEISTLLDGLQKYWPSLSCGSPSNCHGGRGSFWGHEWEKHGTCSHPVVRDEYSYFVTGLNLYFKYNVTKVLLEEGYKPSNSEKYPRGGIVAAIQNAFHTTPELVCRSGALEELRICFYKDFKPRDCLTRSTIQSDSVSSKGSCPDYISLPEMSFGFYAKLVSELRNHPSFRWPLMVEIYSTRETMIGGGIPTDCLLNPPFTPTTYHHLHLHR